MFSGKKGKKNKGKTLNLNEFLSEGNPGNEVSDGNFASVTVTKSSWADEMDDFDDNNYPPTSYGSGAGAGAKIVLPTAPRAARGLDINEDRIPVDPPFTAYVANLPYDIEEEDIMGFFSKLKVECDLRERKMFSRLDFNFFPDQRRSSSSRWRR